MRLPFTRKWNATRHSNNKHDGIREYIITFSKYVIKKRILLVLYLTLNLVSLKKNQLYYESPITINNTSTDSVDNTFDKTIENEILVFTILEPLGPHIWRFDGFSIFCLNQIGKSFLVLFYLTQLIQAILLRPSIDHYMIAKIQQVYDV